MLPDARSPSTAGENDDAETLDPYAPPKLVFVHVMKTAGTSLYRWLQRHYRHEDSLTEATNWGGYWVLPQEVRDSKLFVRGHFGSYITKFHGAAQGFRAISVLRDPVDRAISHYFHGKSAPDAGAIGKAINGEKLSLDEFFEHPRCIPFACNFQVRNFAYDLDIDYETQKLGPAQMFKGPMGDRELQNAIKFLESLDLIGFTERLPEFLASLSQATGFFPDDDLGRSRGYRDSKLKLDPGTEKRIRKANELDIELYEWARNHTAKAKPIMNFNWLRRRQHNPIDLSGQTLHRWRVKDPFFGTGWSDVQGTNTSSSPGHRWTINGETATLRIEVDPDAKYMILLEILRFVRSEQRRHFSLSANGTALDLTGPAPLDNASDGGGVFLATLPPAGQKTCELTFTVGLLKSFNAVNSIDTDKMLRGLALTAITFVKIESDAAAKP
jgi:hypothetical protein